MRFVSLWCETGRGRVETKLIRREIYKYSKKNMHERFTYLLLACFFETSVWGPPHPQVPNTSLSLGKFNFVEHTFLFHGIVNHKFHFLVIFVFCPCLIFRHTFYEKILNLNLRFQFLYASFTYDILSTLIIQFIYFSLSLSLSTLISKLEIRFHISFTMYSPSSVN